MSQSLFAATSQRGLDVVMTTDRLDAGLDTLHMRLTGGKARRDPEKCPLGRNHSHPDGGGGIPGTRAIEAVIRNDRSLERRLCKAFMQDFVCFNFSLPSACADLDPRLLVSVSDHPHEL